MRISIATIFYSIDLFWRSTDLGLTGYPQGIRQVSHCRVEASLLSEVEDAKRWPWYKAENMLQ